MPFYRLITRPHERADCSRCSVENGDFVLVNYLPATSCIWIVWHLHHPYAHFHSIPRVKNSCFAPTHYSWKELMNYTSRLVMAWKGSDGTEPAMALFWMHHHLSKGTNPRSLPLQTQRLWHHWVMGHMWDNCALWSTHSQLCTCNAHSCIWDIINISF
jgi:hypothetical protein